MWRFFKSTAWNTMGNICGDGFRRPFRTDFLDAMIPATSWLANFQLSLRDEKCERCWHCETDIGQNAEHPTICARCVEAVLQFKA